MVSNFKKLLTDVQEQSLTDQKKTLDQELVSWKKETEQTDDILVMGFRL